MLIEVENDEQLHKALDTDKTVLVDFFATWCGPCKILSPVIEEISEELGEDFVMVKADIEKVTETSQKYSIKSVPTIKWFKQGEVVESHVGLSTKKDLISKTTSI